MSIFLLILIPLCFVALVWEMIPGETKKAWHYYLTEGRGEE